jgi:CubicO group peptidase (beta-lactamase class C family)
MNHRPLLILLALVFLGLPAAARADELTDRVDRLVARWNKDGSPGCALGVVRDGRLVYEKAVGFADLEQGRRIGPDTVFHVASVSKQFTAMAVLLLEQDGKLSLDDDVRKHLPELHDFGTTITLRHLLQHTSGLRDQWSLVTLAGWRMDDVITDDDVVRLACRQRELNFKPGARHLYSNTGYTLAARVVERVAGMPFREFARRRIFEPLGMSHTRFPADHQEIIPGRARSYFPAGPGRYKNAVLSYGTAGATSLHTTVADLAHWVKNFDEPRVGDEALIARFQEVGKLNSGRPIGYALGLQVGDYRGLKLVEHSGGDAGFRSHLIRFPSERFAVIVLANAADSSPGELARRVADVYLEGKLKPVAEGKAAPKGKAVPERKEVPANAALFDAYAGEYRVLPGLTVTVTKERGRLTAAAEGFPKRALAAASDREFFVPGEDSGITFDEPVDGQSPSATVRFQGQQLPARRVARPRVTAEQAEEFVGDYYSAELGVIYTVSRRDARLRIRHPRGELNLEPVAAGVFEASGPLGKVTFTRADGRVTGLQIDTARVLRLRFDRVEIKAAARPGPVP